MKPSLAWARIRNLVRPGVEVTPVPEGIHIDWNVPVPVRDGTVLRVNIFRPTAGDGAPVPVILSAHPYNKDLLPAKTKSGHAVNFQYRLFPQPKTIRLSALTSWEAPDPAAIVPRGYAVVNADMRGGGSSEGTARLFSDEEAQDYYDIIEWLAAQPWCNGKVGLEGVSYLAISQYKVAALRPPHLAAICPWEGFSDLYRDFARPGGVRERGFSIVWSKMTARVARVSGDLSAEVRKRRERDAWYETLTPRLEEIAVPMLVCGSFSDHSLHSRGSFEAFRRAGSVQKWLYTHREGKWSTFYAAETQEVRLRFFDFFLKRIENGWEKESPVRLAVYEEGSQPVAISAENAWPPENLTWKTWWLDAESRTLMAEKPELAASVDFAAKGPGVSFWWEAQEDVDLIGPMVLRLAIEMAPGADPQTSDDPLLFIGVRKFRGDREVRFEGSYGFAGDMVTRGWHRVAHQELDPNLTSELQPVYTHKTAEALQPGEIRPVAIALLPQATRMRKGERLRFDVRASWPFPQDPLRGQFPCNYEATKSGRFRLHTGGSHAASLMQGSRPVEAGT